MIDYWTLTAAVNKLTGVAQTTDDIVGRLVAEGIKGDHDCSTCPLAVWFTRELPLAPGEYVSVNGSNVLVLSPARHADDVSVLLPDVLVRLVGAFDNGRYPELHL